MPISRKALTPEVKQFVEYKLEHIQQIEKDLNEYKREMIPSPTPSYSGMPGGGGGESRPVENVSVRMVTDAFVMEAEKTVRAYHRVLDNLEPVDKKLIDLCYWKRSHNKEGAALLCHISKTSAYDRINAILFALAKEMGYINLQ